MPLRRSIIFWLGLLILLFLLWLWRDGKTHPTRLNYTGPKATISAGNAVDALIFDIRTTGSSSLISYKPGDEGFHIQRASSVSGGTSGAPVWQWIHNASSTGTWTFVTMATWIPVLAHLTLWILLLLGRHLFLRRRRSSTTLHVVEQA